MEIDKDKLPSEIHHLVDLLLDPSWPEAVPPFLICDDTEDDKNERAEGILDYIGFEIENKSFCDFGCGEGHLALKANRIASKSIGYDIIQTGVQDCWGTNMLTTNFEEVIHNGPYDYILAYDVLDHCVNPLEALSQIKSICKKETKVFIRFHSWMSRHGGHLYRKLNKAWAHLVFTEQELALMGIDLEYVHKYYTPLITQHSWIKKQGFKIISEDIVKTVVEPFFKKQEIKSRLPLDKYQGQFPEWQMSQVFNDYVVQVNS